jgi:pyrroloquinoline-quinone synthase
MNNHTTLAQSLADRSLTQRPILDEGYFTSLVDGRMSRESFTRSQRQFFFAVRFFSRPMAALMSRMPCSALRRTLMHNLAEEHGLDDEAGRGLDPTMAHDRTFLAFLATLGVSPDDMRDEVEGPAVRAFNLALLGACFGESPAFAYACLGAIEYAFADISALVGKAVVDRDWIVATELVHYKLHAQIDKRHAAELFEEVAANAVADAEAGVAFGLHIFARLYSELHCIR